MPGNHYHGRHTDYGGDYYDQGQYNKSTVKKPYNNRITNTVSYGSIRPVDIDGSIEGISLLVRNFRENAVYTEDSYSHLLRRLCEVCKIPHYKPNWPVFILDPELGSTTANSNYQPKSKYVGEDDRPKELHLRSLDSKWSVKAFVACFYLYLKKRNGGFKWMTTEVVNLRPASDEGEFAEEVDEKSKPQIIRRFDKRSFIQDISL